MGNRKSNAKYVQGNGTCDTIEEHGKYVGLAQVAMDIADEWFEQLDEIERLLDVGENDAAIAAMRKLIGPKKIVKGEHSGNREKPKAVA